MAIENVIVTRHAATIEWLKQHGIIGTVISHVEDDKQITNKIVYGNLPPSLMAKARVVRTISFPKLPQELRGKELTLQQLYDNEAYLETFVVFRGYMTRLVEDYGKETVTNGADIAISQGVA